MDRDLNAIPATMGDIVQLLATVLNEVLDHTATDGTKADEALGMIATNLEALGKNTSNARARLLLVALAQRLTADDKTA